MIKNYVLKQRYVNLGKILSNTRCVFSWMCFRENEKLGWKKWEKMSFSYFWKGEKMEWNENGGYMGSFLFGTKSFFSQKFRENMSMPNIFIILLIHFFHLLYQSHILKITNIFHAHIFPSTQPYWPLYRLLLRLNYLISLGEEVLLLFWD